MFSRILGFIAQNPWLIIIVLGGLFNVGVRMNQKIKEQRAKRAALAEIQRRKAEALRTGRAVDEPIIVYDQQRPAPDDRQARIEALRQKRMEQLRAMREKRTGTGTQQSSIPSQSPSRQPQPSARPVQQAARTPAPQRPGSQRPTPQRPGSGQQQPQQRPKVIPGKQQKPSRVPSQSRQATPKPVVRQRPVVQSPAQPIIRTGSAPKPAAAPPAIPAVTPSVSRSAPRKSVYSGTSGVKSLLRDRSMLRQAIVVKEILDAPIALRDQESLPGQMPR